MLLPEEERNLTPNGAYKGYPPLFSSTLSSLNLYNEDFRIFVVSWQVLWESYRIFQVNEISFYNFQQCLLEHIPVPVFFFFPSATIHYIFPGTVMGGKGATRVLQMMANGKRSPHHSKINHHITPSDRLTKAHGTQSPHSGKRGGDKTKNRGTHFSHFLFLINWRFHTKFWFQQ